MRVRSNFLLPHTSIDASCSLVRDGNYATRASGIIKSVSFAGEMAVLYLYMRYRYNWNEVTFSMFSTFGMVTNLIGKKIISERRALTARAKEREREREKRNYAKIFRNRILSIYLLISSLTFF